MKYWVHILDKMRAKAVLNIALFEVQRIWTFVIHSLMLLPSCSMSVEISYINLWMNIALLFILWWCCPWAKSSIFKHHHLCHYPAICAFVKIVLHISIITKQWVGNKKIKSIIIIIRRLCLINLICEMKMEVIRHAPNGKSLVWIRYLFNLNKLTGTQTGGNIKIKEHLKKEKEENTE